MCVEVWARSRAIRVLFWAVLSGATFEPANTAILHLGLELASPSVQLILAHVSLTWSCIEEYRYTLWRGKNLVHLSSALSCAPGSVEDLHGDTLPMQRISSLNMYSLYICPGTDCTWDGVLTRKIQLSLKLSLSPTITTLFLLIGGFSGPRRYNQRSLSKPCSKVKSSGISLLLWYNVFHERPTHT